MEFNSHWVDQIPFACLVTDRVVNKAMTTRILENVITAIVAAVGGGYFVLNVSIAEDRVKLTALEQTVAAHISEEAQDRREMLASVNMIKECLMKRTCAK